MNERITLIYIDSEQAKSDGSWSVTDCMWYVRESALANFLDLDAGWVVTHSGETMISYETDAEGLQRMRESVKAVEVNEDEYFEASGLRSFDPEGLSFDFYEYY